VGWGHAVQTISHLPPPPHEFHYWSFESSQSAVGRKRGLADNVTASAGHALHCSNESTTRTLRDFVRMRSDKIETYVTIPRPLLSLPTTKHVTIHFPRIHYTRSYAQIQAGNTTASSVQRQQVNSINLLYSVQRM